MRTAFVLLILFHVASTVKHSLEFVFTSSNGLGGIPEFVGALVVDGVQFSYWDSNSKTAKTDNWTREFMKENLNHPGWYSMLCLKNQHDFRTLMDGIRQHLNQSEGVHVLQMRGGCEWDEWTKETGSFLTYGYDGENFMTLDTQQLTWKPVTSLARPIKLIWDTDKSRLEYIDYFYINDCPRRLKKYVPYVRKVTQRTVLPSVSLLQKSPSSPVRCFATGFYPDRAVMFWRKDGEELHKGVDHGEILPNHDDTYQMSADLELPSGDWERYDCVFQIDGVEKDIVTRLDQSVITNHLGHHYIVALIGGSVLLLLICLAALCYISSKRARRTRAQTQMRHQGI